MLNNKEIKELIGRIEKADNWSDIEVEEYERLCESLGFDYSHYSDPDKMFEDIKAAAKKLR